MRIHIGEIPASAADVAAVVEYRQSRLDLIDRLTHASGVVGVYTLAKLRNIRFIIGILALVQ